MPKKLAQSPWFRVGTFITVALLVTGGVHLFLYHRIFLPLWGPDEGGITFLLVVLWTNLFFGFGLLRVLPAKTRQIYEIFLFGWMGFGLFLVMAAAFVLGILSLTSFAVSPEQVARSSFALGLLLSFVSFRNAQRHVVIPTSLGFLPSIDLSSNKGSDSSSRSDSSDEIRAVVLSDVHVSGLLGLGRVKRIVRQVNALDPDLIFVVGDLVDGSVRQLGQAVAGFKGLRTRVAGQVYYVTGNHEYYSGAESWKDFLRGELGWHVLENESRRVSVRGHHLVIVGLEDRQSLHGANPLGPQREDRRLEEALASVPHPLPDFERLILLTHQPKDTEMVMATERVDLQISGHTHAGQIWPFGFVVKKDQRYLRGLFEVRPQRYLYVCQGTGFWGLPFRLGTQCEIALLRLEREAPGDWAERDVRSEG